MIDAPAASVMRSSAAGADWSKFHREAARANIPPELLTKQHLNVRLVIYHKNKEVHARSPGLAMVAALRGRMILISVNSPGCVSTSIDPPCCLTTMS